MDIVQKISSVDVEASETGEMSKPKTPPILQSVIIEEK